MERTFSKPPAARQLEARARARTLGVRVAVVSEARRYVTASQSQPGALYAIERTPVGWACSCQGYEHTGVCKHIAAVERRAEREGWTFGTIAPLSRVARFFPLDLPENVVMRGATLTVAPAVAALAADWVPPGGGRVCPPPFHHERGNAGTRKRANPTSGEEWTP